MYQRLCQGFRMFSTSQRGGNRSPRWVSTQKDLEPQAWRWLSENEKLGVGDLVRQGRWEDAMMFLSFVKSSYPLSKQAMMQALGVYIPLASFSTPRGKQALIEAMISVQLIIHEQIHVGEFHSLPIEECVNPLAIAVKIILAATGIPTTLPSRGQKVEPMSSHDAWTLLQSLLTRVNGTRSSIRKIRDWAYRLPSCDRTVLLLCAADFKGRIRRSMVPVIVTIFYTTVKGALKQNEDMAWSSLQEILSRMSAGLRSQMCAYINSYRKLGYFSVYNLGPTKCCLNDNYLKVCGDLLNDLPQFLWHDLHQSLTEKYNISMERRTRLLSRPSSFQRSTATNVLIFDDRESDDLSLA